MDLQFLESLLNPSASRLTIAYYIVGWSWKLLESKVDYEITSK